MIDNKSLGLDDFNLLDNINMGTYSSLIDSLSVILIMFVVTSLFYGIYLVGKKGYLDGIKSSVGGIKYTFSREKWVKFAPWALGFIWVVVLFTLSGCSSSDSTPPIAAKYCPSVMEDSIDMSPYEDRVKALAIEAKSKGITITGDYATDVAAQGGEMTLVGALRIEVDSNCQIVSSGSWMSLFNADRYPLTGGVDQQGNLGMDANFGGAIVNIRGQIVDGKVTNGKALKSWLPHIYGVFDGDWRML